MLHRSWSRCTMVAAAGSLATPLTMAISPTQRCIATTERSVLPFLRTSRPQSRAIKGSLAEADRVARSRNKKKSHVQIVMRWALFERYCLEFHPDEPFSRWLLKLRRFASDPEEAAGEPRLSFQAPPALILIDYAKTLRFSPDNLTQAKPDHKGSTIRVYVKSAISSVCSEFQWKGEFPSHDERLSDLIEGYADGEESAEAFDMELTLPKLWKAVWALAGWSMLKRICCWAMFLVSCCIMARASCVTQFCPQIDTIKLPKERHWDKDGLPKYIIVFFTNWKSRKRANVGKSYSMKIHRNYLDVTYCPVTWLLYYLVYTEHEEGAIFQLSSKGVFKNITESQWCGMTNHLFESAGIRVNGKAANRTNGTPAVPSSGASNHSIRRSAAQWAGRCGAREMDVRNAGRWRTMVILAKYMGQGAIEREAYEDDEDGPSEDPIFGMWVFKKVTTAGSGGLDEM